MKIKKSTIINGITAVACTAALSAAAVISGAAAPDGEDRGYNSRGKIVFDNNTRDETDDVIFDASDFFVIDGMVSAGKTDIRDALNEYDGVDIGEDIPSFEVLAASVSGLCDGTDAAAGNLLEGKKALVEKNMITGTMPDHGGITTPADGIAESEEEEAAEITIPEGYYDRDSRISIPIETIKESVPSLNSSIPSELTLSGTAWVGDSDGYHNTGRFFISIPSGWKTASGCSYRTYLNDPVSDGTLTTVGIAPDKTGDIGTFGYKSMAWWTLHLVWDQD
ncbi:MAG: hypothetical protein NC337_05475 [Roseburia sp.]|nr:hypothetical protein [Roseburia sp.]